MRGAILPNPISLRSLMVLAKSIRVSCILAFAMIPNILWVVVSIWVFLDGEVGVATHEESVQWAALSICEVVSSLLVLGVKHSLASEITLWLLYHSGKWLQVWSVVPGVRASHGTVSEVLSEAKSSDDR